MLLRSVRVEDQVQTDTIAYLKEKAEKEMEYKKEEMAMKMKIKREQVLEQKVIREQQTQMMETFNNMQ